MQITQVVSRLLSKVTHLRGSRLSLAAAVAVLVYTKYRRDAANRRKNAIGGGSGGGGPVAKGRSSKKGAVSWLWRLLFPKKFSLASDPTSDSAGSRELLAMLALCLSRIWIMDLMSRVTKGLDSNQMTRDQTEFWRLFKHAVGVASLSVLHRNTYKYVENTLGVIWQKKITSYIHGLYFKDMAYYQVAQGAALGGDLTDPDERIASDAREVATQLSLILCEFMYSSTAGVFFAYKLGRLYGTRYAIAPYVYLMTALTLSQTLAPFNWGRETGKLRGLLSKARDSLSRLVANQEAIAALQGSEVEDSIIRRRFAAYQRAVTSFDLRTIWPNFLQELGFSWLTRTFVGVFVIGPHVMAQSAVGTAASLAELAALRGAIGYQFVLFIQSMIAAGVTAKLVKNWQKLGGPAGRVYELVHRLRELNAKKEKETETNFTEGGCIEFKNVRIVTPTGNTLVEDLSFKLEEGSSLLLTGHNGAGKSSIFRCLGGLWPIPSGTIVKPSSGESGLHQDVFYLPQKPYTVLGTLRDQLTYPLPRGSRPISDAELREILGHVGLAHLVEGEDVERNWEMELSLGEKQRLAIARLVFHKPRFAVLDECTSASSGEMERQLYQWCKDFNITVITISPRPFLKAYHDRILTIGDGKQGFKLEKIDHDALPAKQTTFSQMREASVLDHSTAADRAAIPPLPRKSTWKRFLVLLNLGLPRTAVFSMVGTLVGIVLQSALLVRHTGCVSGMMSSVFMRDRDAFVRHAVTGAAISTAGCVVEQAVGLLQSRLGADLRAGLTTSLLDRLMRDDSFYRLTQLDRRVQDPDKRIGADVHEFSATVASLFPQLIKPLVEITWFTARLHSLVGMSATTAFVSYLGVGAAMIRLAIPNFQHYVKKEAELEGNFKLVHSRVRTHAESIAFFGGDAREHALVNERFAGLMQVVAARLRSSWFFGLINQAIIREAPALVQWQLRNEYGRTWGSDEAVAADGGVTLNKNQLFIFEATHYAFDALGQVLSFGEKVANLSGYIVRISELHEILDELAAAESNLRAGFIESSGISFKGVDLVTPSGRVLASDISLDVTPDKPLMVTGPNASGKTAFFRILAGMWPIKKGTVARPISASRATSIKDVFLVPQKMYLVTGTLADQITYPHVVLRSQRDETHLRRLLATVGIEHLADREGGFDAEVVWEDVLSLGEQQRVGMARLYYHAPSYGILDECTSAVSVDIEEQLYREAIARGITCITISQRPALQGFHAQELRLGQNNSNGHLLLEAQLTGE